MKKFKKGQLRCSCDGEPTDFVFPKRSLFGVAVVRVRCGACESLWDVKLKAVVTPRNGYATSHRCVEISERLAAVFRKKELAKKNPGHRDALREAVEADRARRAASTEKI